MRGLVSKNELAKTKLQLENNENLLEETQRLVEQLTQQLAIKENALNEVQRKLNNKESLLRVSQHKLKQSENNLKKKEEELKKLNSPMKYKGKALPSDLSNQDLSGYDFTGCDFTHTNLTDSNLANVILAHTTCNYQKAFQHNIKNNKCDRGKWYQENLLKDLKSIAVVYPKLKNDPQKAKLLAIAAGLAWLPFYTGEEFHIKVGYWSCELLQLKQAIGNPYGQQLVCSLEEYLNWDAEGYCWSTNYPKDKVNMDTKAPHASFDTYFKDFINGLTKYQCKSKNKKWGFDWYKEQIAKNIEGLKKTYQKIKDEQLRQACCNIAHALSKSYQIRNGAFLNHYLFSQNRLIWLKKSVGVMVGNEVYYSYQTDF